MKAMILAAGRGERLRPLTDTTPKPLLEVGGQPLIAHHLHSLATAGCCDIVINLAYRSAQIRYALGTGQAFGVNIAYSDEGDQPLETGGGIRQALPLLGEQPFWVINADIWCDYPMTKRTLPDNDLAHLIMVDNPPHHPTGDFRLQASRLVVSRGIPLTFSGIGLYSPAMFRDHAPGRFALAPLLRAASARGRIGGEHHPGIWFDIGTRERLAATDAFVRARG